MYDELVKALRDSNCATKGMCGMCSKRDKPCIYRFASEAADAIEKLLAERDEVNAESWKTAFEVEHDEHRWIPVTELLPEDGVRVLAYFQRNGYSAMNVAWCEQNDERVVWSNCQFIPTHWMPLPEPPKEE